MTDSFVFVIAALLFIIVCLDLFRLAKQLNKRKLNNKLNITKFILEKHITSFDKDNFLENTKNLNNFLKLMLEMKKHIGESIYAQYFEDIYLFFIYYYYKKNQEQDVLLINYFSDDEFNTEYSYIFNFLVYAYKEYLLNIKYAQQPKGYSLTFFKLLEQLWLTYFKERHLKAS